MFFKNNERKKIIFLSVAASVLFCIGFYPAIKSLMYKWATSDDYNHAFLTLPIIFYIIFKNRALLLDTDDVGAFFGLFILILSLPLYLVSLQLHVPTITFICMMAVFMGSLIFLGGIKVLRGMATPLLLLLLIIPVPSQIYSMVTMPMQLKVSQTSEWLIRALGIPIFRQGNVLFAPEKTFMIVEACSGMRSLIAMVTFSVIMAYFTLNRNASKAALVFLSIPVTFIMNFFRVVTMIFAFHFYRIDLLEGNSHTTYGLFIFAIALSVLFAFQKVLKKWELRKKSDLLSLFLYL